MTPLWTSADIAAATAGVASTRFEASGVAFDSREVGPGDLFVALRGTVSDGHRHVADAFARGASGALVAEPVGGAHVLVADTQAALEALGRAARARATAATVIGVTGSVGKTGVKETLRAVFERQGRTHASVKSYNNHTGVPLSLARMPADARWGVFEMGMNHAGEIARLTRQVRPHVSLVTMVGVAHIENFACEEAIADAKAEVFEGLEPGGAAVLPVDNRHFARLRSAAVARGARVIGFGQGAEAEVRAVKVVEDGEGSDVEGAAGGEAFAFRVAIPGRHRVHNLLAVIAATYAAGGRVADAVWVAGATKALPGRGRVLATAGGARVLDECYNANPDSMAAALATLAAMRAGGRKLAVLGAMRELGGRSDAAHAALAPLIARAGVAELALVGPEMAPLAAALPNARHLADAARALDWARTTLRPGDLLLVKGSNSVGLGALVAALAGEPA